MRILWQLVVSNFDYSRETYTVSLPTEQACTVTKYNDHHLATTAQSTSVVYGVFQPRYTERHG